MKKFRKEITGIVAFLHEAEKLKSILRHSWLSSGRRESVAEHTWRMGLMAIIIYPHLAKKNQPDLGKTLQMITIHDLCEVYAGDDWAWKKAKTDKYIRERKSLQKIISSLGIGRKKMMELWEEFEKGKSKEAKLAQAMDKIEALLQHLEAGMKRNYPKEYKLNLVYGIPQTSWDPFLKALRLMLSEQFLKMYKKHNIHPKLYA